MKCPKCDYLGYETGDRCRNCGYDFSLMTSSAPEPDFDLRLADPPVATPDAWLKELDHDLATLDESVASTLAADAAMVDDPIAPIAPAIEEKPLRFTLPSLPLFTGADDDDAPLVKLPAAPRAPLAVRRTPENPRLRSLSKAVRKEPEPELQFDDTPAPRDAAPASVASGLGAPSARLLAALVDNLILGVVDVTVLYFTLKVAALSPSDWQLIPIAPMVAFLLLVKCMYFAAFTAVGGQTIGKMGSGIRVVADDGSSLDPTRALRRSLAGVLSLATLGAAFLPAILGEDRRAIHDRVAGTRVVTA